jgi:hypothetical protein
MGLIRECNLYSCLIKGIVNSKKASHSPSKLKNYKWWFVKAFHLSSMQTKNINLPWKYQSYIKKVCGFKKKCDCNYKSKWVRQGLCELPITNRVTRWKQTHHHLALFHLQFHCHSLWLSALNGPRRALTNHELLNQESTDKHPLFYIIKKNHKLKKFCLPQIN